MKNSYMPQLDSLRTFAVAAVAYGHWCPQYKFGIPFHTGVQLFFVLSGFLITDILLNAKDKREEKGFILKRFYIRRFLRIFPLYYAVLTAVYLLGIRDFESSLLWHYLYLSNYYNIASQGWTGQVSHFWTLAVEEQFYIFWPLVVLFIPNKKLPKVFLSFIMMAVAYRAISAIFYPEVILLDKATPGSFDSLALGALMAYGRRYSTGFWQTFIKHRTAVSLVSIGIYLIIRISDLPITGDLHFFSLFLISCVYLAIISKAAEGFSGTVGRILNLKFLIYLGKISYGLYIFHNFVGLPTHLTIKYLPFLAGLPLIKLVLNCFWLVVVSSLSWHFFEKPINSLKKNYPYVRTGT